VNDYELTVIIRISDSLESNKEKVKSILQKYGVTIVSDDSWGTRRLAYMIDGEKEGYYLLLRIQSPPDALSKILAELRLNSDLLRYLFVRVHQKKSA